MDKEYCKLYLEQVVKNNLKYLRPYIDEQVSLYWKSKGWAEKDLDNIFTRELCLRKEALPYEYLGRFYRRTRQYE